MSVGYILKSNNPNILLILSKCSFSAFSACPVK